MTSTAHGASFLLSRVFLLAFILQLNLQMMMMIENLQYSFFIFLVLIFPQTCCCMQNPPPHHCIPSSCGDIRNISFPFRLKTDPKQCGYPLFELECDGNTTTILKLKSHKYKVKAINYANQTIRVADVSVRKNNSCSFPYVSLDNSNFSRDYPYVARTYRNSSHPLVEVAWPINFMRCPYPLKNFFTELPTHCDSSTHTYVKAGHMEFGEVRDNCSIDIIVLTSWKFRDGFQNVSISEIHEALLYGFELIWVFTKPRCIMCSGRWKCPPTEGDRVNCRQGIGEFFDALWDNINAPYYGTDQGSSSAIVLILFLFLVVVFAGITLPAMIIIAITSASTFIYIEMFQQRQNLNLHWPVAHLRLIIGLLFAVRFIVVFPCLIWLFVYKFRRRHLSRFAAIEEFLQSENNQLMPIRYSYSDIKKMTRGFQEKLGQGGYGTVYKGKLRSGYDVAVKLLVKPGGGNGQDFMNEISTIGRIHHVNIVKLVGYCAERSKRALVFDYMPNGSLDKYIYSREKRNSLSWERKYEIAVGVARGIEYLHRGCDIQILHFDIKPHNILLDDKFIPKITDFGLAKFFPTDKKVVTMTAIRGTIGYVAPELINRGFGGVSYKADVYSFGMLLMEMVGLNKDLERNNQASSQYFPCWIYDCFEQGHDIEFEVTDENNKLDEGNSDDHTNGELAKKMTIVGLWCIQMSPGDRPSMNKVVEMLEAPIERLRVPNRPCESNSGVGAGDESCRTYSTDSISSLGNEITVVD